MEGGLHNRVRALSSDALPKRCVTSFVCKRACTVVIATFAER
jgi:hypothetical protein